MSVERLTAEELEAIADGKDWRVVTCRACGERYVVEAHLRVFSCACSQRGPVAVNVVDERPGRLPRPVETPAGPSATERLVREVRLLRSDEWLHAAARDVMTTWPPGTAAVYRDQAAYDEARTELMAILKRHRDGDAARSARRFHSDECSAERRRDPRVCVCGAGDDAPDFKRGTRDGEA